MNIGDKLTALKLPLLGTRRDPAEEERLLKLFWNRAELKKELGSLDEQLYQLRDRLKQQEGATARVADQMESLETLLGNPELGFGALVHFQLRALWRACHLQLEQFGSELRRQQEEKDRKRQLVEFHQDRQQRVKLAEQRLHDAEAALEQENLSLDEQERRLAAQQGFWTYFRRRALTASVASQRERRDVAARYLDDMRESKRTIEKEPWPEFPGIALEGRRAINVAVIAYAQILYARLAEEGLAVQSRQAKLRSVQEARYGSRDECIGLMRQIAAALALIKDQKDLPAEIKTRSEQIRAGVVYRLGGDSVPEPTSLPSALAGRGGGVSIREPNVLLDDYWDIYKVLLR
jgi:hypothetical protein